MPQYLLAVQHPDNHEPPADAEAMMRDISALNREMIAAGVRDFAGGLQPAGKAKSVRHFWNPKVRVPICLNAAAARTCLLRITRITDLALAGRTPAQVKETMVTALARKELPPMEPGAMGHAVADPSVHLTQFVIPVQRWSDGMELLPAPPDVHP